MIADGWTLIFEVDNEKLALSLLHAGGKNPDSQGRKSEDFLVFAKNTTHPLMAWIGETDVIADCLQWENVICLRLISRDFAGK